MTKKKVIALLISCLCLTGCSLSTPQGTVTLTYDKDTVSDSTVFTSDDGKTTTINTQDIKSYVNQLIESVDIPNGGSTEDLKEFVYSNLEALGIDLDKIDLNDTESVDEAESAIKEALEEQGIDTSDLDLNLEEAGSDGEQ
jgi:hypothetical protein